MRRCVIAASILSACGLACIPENIEEPTVSPYPVYTVHARAARRTHENAVKSAPHKAPARTLRSWHPRAARISSRWTTIVIHHSGTSSGGAKTFDRHHREHNGWDELGYHFVIGNGTATPDGFVEVGSRWHKQKHGAHCKTPDNYYNEHGIGICLVGNFDRTKPTARQMASLERLLRYLCTVCKISPRQITTHRGVTGKTRCPGRNLSLTALRRAMTARTKTLHRR